MDKYIRFQSIPIGILFLFSTFVFSAETPSDFELHGKETIIKLDKKTRLVNFVFEFEQLNGPGFYIEGEDRKSIAFLLDIDDQDCSGVPSAMLRYYDSDKNELYHYYKTALLASKEIEVSLELNHKSESKRQHSITVNGETFEFETPRKVRKLVFNSRRGVKVSNLRMGK